MRDIDKYYKTYHEANGYRMLGAKDTSRVSFLKDWVKKYTPEGGKVLDIGCGDMYLSEVLPEYKWTGMDINVEFAKDKIVEHNLSDVPYPFKKDEFDTVVCSEVLEHVWDLRIIHKEVKRMLKPDGTYIISTPNFDHIDHFISHFRDFLFDVNKPHLFEHIRFYNAQNHTKILDSEGFKVVEQLGADAHYSHFFVKARMVLVQEEGMSVPEADKLIGRMFPDFSHTIMLVGKKPT